MPVPGLRAGFVAVSVAALLGSCGSSDQSPVNVLVPEGTEYRSTDRCINMVWSAFSRLVEPTGDPDRDDFAPGRVASVTSGKRWRQYGEQYRPILQSAIDAYRSAGDAKVVGDNSRAAARVVVQTCVGITLGG